MGVGGNEALANEEREMEQAKEIKGQAKARFFSRGPIETRKVLVESDNTVRVWDDVAGHYTMCHSLSPRTQARIAKEVRAAA